MGESCCWIDDFTPSKVSEWDFPETVIVNWPTDRKSPSDSTVQQFAACVIAFSDSQSELRHLKEKPIRWKQEKQDLLESIRFIKELPQYITAFEKFVTIAERVSSLLQKTSDISPKMIDRCSTHDYRKFTSDLLVVMFGREILATHSLTGAKSVKGDGIRKDPLDPEKLEVVFSKKWAMPSLEF